MATQTYKPGDFLPDGRQVLEVDEHGNPTVVKRPRPKPPEGPRVSERVAAETDAGDHKAGEPPTKKTPKARKSPPKKTGKPAVDPDVVKAKLAAASVPTPTPEPEPEDPDPEPEREEPETDEQEPEDEAPSAEAESVEETDVAAKKKAGRKKKAATKAAPKKSTRKGNRWSPEVIAKYKAQIKDGKATYASIAETLEVRPQTVWAQLNSDKLKKNKPAKKKAPRKK